MVAQQLVLDARARARTLATLKRYVHHETPTGDRHAITAFVDSLAYRYADLGATTELHPVAGGVHLVADFPGHGAGEGLAPVLLVGHADTVWPVGTVAGTVPWTDDGERITGPGVYDMKSGLVVIEEALQLTGHAPDRLPVRVIITADEEIGSPSSKDLIAAAAVGCSSAIGFESPHPDGALKVGRLGSTRIRFHVTGVEAHAALDPERGISAAEELVDQLAEIRQIVTETNGSVGPDVLFNIGSIDAPGRTNVVSSEAVAELGFRFSGPEVEAEILAQVETPVAHRRGAKITVSRLSYRPAWAPREADLALATTLAELAGRLAGAAGVAGLTASDPAAPQVAALPAPRPAAGAADTNFLGNLDIAVVDGFGPQGGAAHARGEHVIVASLWQRITLLAAFLTAA